MILKFEANTAASDIKKVLRVLDDLGIACSQVSFSGANYFVSSSSLDEEDAAFIEELNGVESVISLSTPYKLTSRIFQAKDSQYQITPTWQISNRTFSIVAGPCAVENQEQILITAKSVALSGASALRGGAFKPRTSTYDFQGLGEEGLQPLQEAKQSTGLPVVTEILSPNDLEQYIDYLDVVQIGARSMQNFPLLKAAGELGKPVLLKRGMMSTIDELLQAAEYIFAAGNSQIILCERGIRTFESATRNTLDLNAVAALKEKTHLPVFVDPSHGTGNSRHVPAMCRAALACGADGLLIEVHNCPALALSDGQQSLDLLEFKSLVLELEAFSKLMGRQIVRSALDLSAGLDKNNQTAV